MEQRMWSDYASQSQGHHEAPPPGASCKLVVNISLHKEKLLFLHYSGHIHIHEFWAWFTMAQNMKSTSEICPCDFNSKIPSFCL